MNKISAYAFLFAITPPLVIAQEAIELDPILVVSTATKTEKKIDGVTASIEVITAKDIRRQGASTLKDILNKSPSLTTQYGGFPHPSSKSKAAISIRGAGANGTLILIDGKRVSAETENPYEMDRIPASMIERIEIVKGSMSTLYGSDAIGGVINIITKTPTKTVTHIDVKLGQNSDGDAKEKTINLSTMGIKDKLKYKIYASLISTEPFTISKSYVQQAVNPSNQQPVANPINGVGGNLDVSFRDEADINTFGVGLIYDISDSTEMGFDLNVFSEDREGQYLGLSKMPTSPTTAVIVKNTPVNSVDDNQRTDISFDFKHTSKNDVIYKTRVYRSDYEKRNKTTAINFTAPVNRKFSADVIIDGLETHASLFANDDHLITIGAEYRKETRHSSAINPDPSSNEFITKEDTFSSLFAQDEIEINDRLNATIGIRYDDISDADSKTTAKAGIIKNLENGFNVRANFAQGYRVPDVAERFVVAPFFRDARRFGSEVIFGPKNTAHDLKPESSESIEFAVSKRSQNFYAEVVIFQSDIEDKIALVAKNSNTPQKYYTSENIKNVKIQGVEITANFVANKQFSVNFNATSLDTKNKANGKQLTFTPKLSAAVTLNYQLNKLTSSLSLKQVGKQYTDEQNTQTADSYSTVDLSMSYHVNKTINVYGGINNLSDADIDEELGATVGRFIFAGLRTQF